MAEKVYTQKEFQKDKVLVGKLVAAKKYQEAHRHLSDVFLVASSTQIEKEVSGMLFVLDMLVIGEA